MDSIQSEHDIEPLTQRLEGGKVTKGHVSTHTKHETQHLWQWAQKHFKQHHGYEIQNGCNKLKHILEMMLEKKECTSFFKYSFQND